VPSTLNWITTPESLGLRAATVIGAALRDEAACFAVRGAGTPSAKTGADAAASVRHAATAIVELERRFMAAFLAATE
jgi:hypothetical protein